jgi:IS30 family transposase
LDGRQVTGSCDTFVYHNKEGCMKKYRHLTFEDRIYIEVWHYESRSLSYMASRLGVHPSTISRELKRGRTGWLSSGYRADLGEEHKRRKGMYKGRRSKLVGSRAKQVIELIKQDWSPEQIAERTESASHETIYKLVKDDRENGGSLFLHLRRSRRRRKKRFHVPRMRGDILRRRHISTRPTIIDERARFGDWERDLLFGSSRSRCVIAFVERTTCLTRLKVLENKSPRSIAKATIEILSKETCHSVTNDNGFEFRAHEMESKRLGVPIYFTNPYSSWEKGTCENQIGLIRQYISKEENLEELSEERLKEIEQRLNSRPRKKIGFQTPLEASGQGGAL